MSQVLQKTMISSEDLLLIYLSKGIESLLLYTNINKNTYFSITFDNGHVANNPVILP